MTDQGRAPVNAPGTAGNRKFAVICRRKRRQIYRFDDQNSGHRSLLGCVHTVAGCTMVAVQIGAYFDILRHSAPCPKQQPNDG